MTENSKYITILCGEFADGYKPLTRAKFWETYHKSEKSIKKMIESGIGEVSVLLKRSGSVAFKIEELEKRGIKITTFLDEEFPKRLLRKLKDKCPPLFYYCGNTELNQYKYVGYVGSRNIEQADEIWLKKMIDKNMEKQFCLVSGGAKGIDSLSTSYALERNSFAIEFLANNLEQKIKDQNVLRNLIEGRLLLYSAVSPFAKQYRSSFVAAAMERNKFIYAQASGTVVVRSDFGKGGTWAGATEGIRNEWSKVYVWDKKEYEGNQTLIQKGGIGLDEEGELTKNAFKNVIRRGEDNIEYEQRTLFDNL